VIGGESKKLETQLTSTWLADRQLAEKVDWCDVDGQLSFHINVE